MGPTTDELVALAGAVSSRPHPREQDMLLTAGEQISIALLSMAIIDLGRDAISFTGPQAGIVTDASHGRAKIVEVGGHRVRDALDAGKIAIVAGFQGISPDADVTTLGRGGSDTTAVAVAAALNADVCEIYTDVDGIFSADPRIVPDARHIAQITYEEMLELAACGAKVLHLRSVEYARRSGLPIHVRSSYSTNPGTMVSGSMEDLSVEQALITGVAHDRSEAKITIVGVPDEPGQAAHIFETVASAETNIDMIVQNVSTVTTDEGGAGRYTDISFTLPKSDGPTAMAALEKVRNKVGFRGLLFDDHVGKVSLIGAGMRSHPGVAATFFAALAEAGVNIEMISTSEIRVSVVCRDPDLEAAVRAGHDAFELGGDGEAVVYAGTGR